MTKKIRNFCRTISAVTVITAQLFFVSAPLISISVARADDSNATTVDSTASATPIPSPTDSATPTPIATPEPTAEAGTPTPAPQLSTDQPDYSPGQTATIFGSFFQALQNLVLKIFGGSTADNTYTETTQNVTADSSGSFTTNYTLDNIFRPQYYVTASDSSGTQLAQTSFTDAPLSLDSQQCRNGTAGSPNNCLNLGGGNGWVTGNANATQSHFKEGDTIPYRIVINNPTASQTYAVSVLWDTRKSGINATDYIAYARTIPEVVDPCDGAGSTTANCALPPINSGSLPAGVTAYDISSYILLGTSGTPTTLQCNGLKTGTAGAISATPGCTSYTNLRSASVGGTRAGQVIIVGGTLQDIRLPQQDALSTNPATSETTSSRVVFYVTASSASNVVISFGGHIASRLDWGTLSGVPQSAGGISGSPYHLSKEGLCSATISPTDCTTGAGSGDLQLAAAAVSSPSTITIHKVTSPNASDLTVFSFTTSGTGYSNFNLTGGNQNQQSISGTGSYTVVEIVPSGWNNTGLTCTATGTGSSATPTPSTHSVAITIGSSGGAVIDCTFTNTLQQAHLTLVKTVANDNGGAALNTAWTLAAAGPTPVSGATGSGAVTNAAVNAGAYTLSESGGPSGYTAGTYSCVVNGGAPVVSNSITLAAGDNATCTINNNDNAPSLTLNKVVSNTHGGTATASQWTLTAIGTGGSPTNLSGTTPVNSGSNFKADTYTLAESGGLSGYTASVWSCTNGVTVTAGQITLGLGQSTVCTITNSDTPAHLTLVKVVTNDNGGAKTVTDFSLTATGPTTITGVSGTGAVTNAAVSAGSYALSEVTQTGYAPSSWFCTGGTQSGSNIALTLGQSATCTITNDDVAPTLKLVKVVTNDNGGAKNPADWTLTATGSGGFSDAGNSTTFHPVTAGVGYVLSESVVAGYNPGSWSCDAGSLVGSTVTLGVGQNATCTISNNDQPAHIIVIKHLDNGATGATTLASAFAMHIIGTAGTANFAGAEDPGVNTQVNAGTYAVSEDPMAGYSSGATGDCSGSIANGETKTCTITNTAIAPTLKVIKVVDNGNTGAIFIAADFQMKIDGGNVPQNSAQTETVGSHAVTESGPAGYTSVFSGDCDSNGNVSLALADNKTCTITNTAIAPKLKLVKTVINDNAGTKQVADFPLFIDTNGVTSGVSNPETVGFHTATETSDPGYAASLWGTDCAANGTITLALGDDKTCTITNDDIQPKLTVIKVVINHGGNKVVADFPLFVDATGVTSGVQNGFNAATYIVSETGNADYTATISGDCNSQTGAITLVPGDVKSCTITNEEKPSKLIVHKVVVNHGLSNDATHFAPYKVDSTTITLDAENTFNSGLHAVSEVTDSNYTATFSQDCDTQGNVTLTPGITKECTIINIEKPSTITVKKVVINHGLQNDASHFADYKVDTEIVALNLASTFNSGNHTVSEATDSDYTATFSGDCNANGVIVLGSGENKTCTITNEEKPTYLTVSKVVINHGQNKVATDFGPFNVDGSPVVLDASNLVNSGIHAVTENQDPNYNVSYSTECLNGSITLASGDDKTCTITNEEKPAKLIVTKVVTNDNGGTKVVSDFPLFVDQTGVTSGDTNTFDSGAHAVSETGNTDYAATITGDCNAQGNVTLVAGQTKSCTITNNDIAPKLHLIKVVTNDNGGTATVADFTLTADGTGLNDLSGISPVDSDVTLKADTFALSETNMAGYAVSAWVCVGGTQNGSNITLGLNQEATCTITNDDQQAYITIIKDADPNDLQDFVFGGTLGVFMLDDDAGVLDEDTVHSNSQTFNSLSANTNYTITETLPNPFWTFNGVSCVITGTTTSYPFTPAANGLTVNLTLGGNVTCTFNNHKESPTRTQGFWQTHTFYTSSVFTVLTNPMKIGTNTTKINDLYKLFGAFYSSIPNTTLMIVKKAVKRSEIDKARMQLLQQLVAAKLNCAAFGCATSVQTMISTADTAYATGTVAQILASASALDAFNNSGDTIIIGNAGSATPKTSQSSANKSFWDTP